MLPLRQTDSINAKGDLADPLPKTHELTSPGGTPERLGGTLGT